jgi:hypothetical protein
VAKFRLELEQGLNLMLLFSEVLNKG